MKEDFDHIKKRLRDYESPLNLDEAWEGMQQLQQKRRTRWRRKSSALLLLLLISSCGAIWLLGKRPGQHLESSGQMDVPPTVLLDPQQADQSVSKTTAPTSHLPGNTLENATLTHTAKHFTTSKPLTTQESTKTGNSLPGILNRPSGYNDTTQKTNTSNNSMSGISLPAVAPTLTHEWSSNSGKTSSAIKPEIDPDDSGKGLQQSKAGNASIYAQIPLPPSSIQKQWLWMDVLSERVLGKMTSASRTTLTLPVLKIGLSPVRPARKAPIRKYLQLSSGIVLAQQQLNARTIEEANYAILRSTSETGLPGLSTDLGISLEVSRRNYVDIALRYDMWYDRFVYQYEQSKEYTLTNVLLGVVRYEPIGTEERVYGDTVISGKQTVKATYFNRYTAADLRLAFGHTLWERRRLSLDMTAGVSANIYKKINGHIAGSEPADVVIDLQQAPYKQSLGLSVYADFRLNYRLTPRLDIQLRPSTLFGLSDALKSSAPTSAHFRRTSLQLGLRTRF